MSRYTVNKNGDHEVHKIANCNNLPETKNRIDFNADTDSEAMRKAKVYYRNADGCKFCMTRYHEK
jgi:hypothetical protein